MKPTFRIGFSETEDGYSFYDVYDYDNTYLESFRTEELAIEWLYDEYGRDIVIL